MCLIWLEDFTVKLVIAPQGSKSLKNKTVNLISLQENHATRNALELVQVGCPTRNLQHNLSNFGV